jgi:rRNA biogenesis protein RRP5
LQSLQPGTKIWGAVLDVTSKRLTVALPHGLRGHVTPADASDVLAALLSPSPSGSDARLRAAITGPPPGLPDLFYPGQLVQCAVKALQDAKGDPEKDAVRRKHPNKQPARNARFGGSV